MEDLEKVRKHLKIDKWHVFGGSWGSTLALAYAQTYPQRVLSLVLRGIFLCRREELLWLYQSGANQIFPDQFEPYWNFIPPNERGDMMSAYYRRLTGNDEEVKLEAARVWSIWEAATSCLFMKPSMLTEFEDPKKALPFARIESHYFVHGGFLKSDSQLLDQAPLLNSIPGVIVQGRYDVVCPMQSAWELHKVWKNSKLIVVPDAGHSAFEPGIQRALVQACDAIE